MGVLDSSYIKALGVKSAGLKRIFSIFQDTLLFIWQNLLRIGHTKIVLFSVKNSNLDYQVIPEE